MRWKCRQGKLHKSLWSIQKEMWAKREPTEIGKIKVTQMMTLTITGSMNCQQKGAKLIQSLRLKKRSQRVTIT